MYEKPISFGSFTINDASKESLTVSPFYFIQVRNIDGLHGADISYESHPIPGYIGEKSGDVFRRGKTITVSGTIFARGLAELRAAQRYLQEMLWDTDIRQFKFTPWNDGFQLFINCRVSQDLVTVDQMLETGPTGGFRATFTFALRADNPRTYKVADSSLYPTWQTV